MGSRQDGAIVWKFVVSLKPMVRFKIFGDYEVLLEEKKRNNNPAIEVEPGEPNEDDDTEPELLEDMSDLPINDNLIHDIIETWEESDDEANQ